MFGEVMFKITYVGQGVVSNALGSFQNGTIAYTADEAVAKEIALQDSFEVHGPDGMRILSPSTVSGLRSLHPERNSDPADFVPTTKPNKHTKQHKAHNLDEETS